MRYVFSSELLRIVWVYPNVQRRRQEVRGSTGDLTLAKPVITTRSSAVEEVFRNFISRLRAEAKINTTAINEIESCLSGGQYSADRLKTALFTEEAL